MKRSLLTKACGCLAVSCMCLATLSCDDKLGAESQQGIKIKLNVNIEGSTRGSLITRDNIDKFNMDAVLGETCTVGPANKKYISGAVVNKTSPITWATDRDYYWVDDVPLHFWSYAPAASDRNGILVIDSESATANEISFSYAVAAQSDSQDDLVFAYNIEMRKCNEDDDEIIDGGSSNVGGTNHDGSKNIQNTNEINIHFYHALSQIKFAVSPDDDTFDTDLVIEAIRINNVADFGTCVYDGALNAGRFAWTPATDSYADYELTDLDEEFTEVYGFAELASDETDNTYWTYGTYTNGGPKTLFTTSNLLFLIPQDHRDESTQGLGKAEIEVVFHRRSTGNEETVSVDIKDNWEAGKYYTYKIKATTVATSILLDYVLVVNDWVDGKKDLML